MTPERPRSAALAPPAGVEHSAEGKVIASILEEWARSVHNHDIDGVLRHHDPGLQVFDVVGPTSFNGLARYRNSWEEQFFPWHGGTGRFELEAVDVRAGDRVAFATALIKCAGTEHGQPVAYTVRLTVGLEKKDGGWSIVHEHHSEPLPSIAAGRP